MSAKHRCVIACLAAAVLACGCISVEDINRRIPLPEVVAKKAPNAEYVVDPPDTIQVEFLGEAGLTRVEQVRSDGVVTLPFVQDVLVAGLTTDQIRQKLEELYATYYKDPEILVKVVGFRSKRIFVYGEVRRVGEQPYTGYQTLLDAIGGAGGLTTRAAWSRARVIRADLEEPEVFKVNLDKLILGGDARRDVMLAENDVVYVPPTALAWFGYQIQSLLFPAREAVALVATPAAIGGGTTR